MIQPYKSLMLNTLVKPIVASLQLFALYVVLHGHYSPGGGFQGGVLFACSLILPTLVYGREEVGLVVSMRTALTIASIGVLLFAGTGIAATLFGGSFMDYSLLPLASSDAMRRSLGILLIEVGVTLAVTGAVVCIFYVLYADFPESREKAIQLESLGEDPDDL